MKLLHSQILTFWLENKQKKESIINISVQKRSEYSVTLHMLNFGLVLFLCTSCADYSQYSLPLQNQEKFMLSGTEAIADPWWLALEDARLNGHIETALEKNFTLAAAWERLNGARAIARREASDLYPDLEIASVISINENSGRTDGFSAGAAASYELDLWGRIRAAVEAEDLRAMASEEAYRTAALTLSSDIALTWVRLVEAHNQSALLQRQINTNGKTLEVLRALFGAGLVRIEDILRQELLIESVQEEQITIESEIGTLEHQLAVLRGEPPQGKIFEPSKDIADLRAMPKTGLPSELILRRPDIRSAVLEIEAADKDLAAAVRNQYPSITLSASYISEAASAGNLFSGWVTTLAGGLVAPLFDGGERRAEVSRSEAVRAELLNLYGQTVLEAFREVEDALTRELKQRERINSLEAQLILARNTIELIEFGYLNGASEFISLLSAQTVLQRIERDLLLARRNIMEFRIALYRSLAGGFEMPGEIEKIKGQ